jgi:hypothetical protein
MQWYDMGTWSVANEMFFYLLFPFALPLLLRVQRPAQLVAVLGALVLFGTALGVGHWLRPDLFTFPRVFAFPPSRFSEFDRGTATLPLQLARLSMAGRWAARGGCRLPVLGRTTPSRHTDSQLVDIAHVGRATQRACPIDPEPGLQLARQRPDGVPRAHQL